MRWWELSFLSLRKIGDMNFPCSCSQGNTALFFNNLLTSTLSNDLCPAGISYPLGNECNGLSSNFNLIPLTVWSTPRSEVMLSSTDICLEMQPAENWSIHMYKYSLNLGKYSRNKLTFLVQFSNICSFSCW